MVLLNLLGLPAASLTASSAALSDWGDPSIATRIFLARFSISSPSCKISVSDRRKNRYRHFSSLTFIKHNSIFCDNHNTMYDRQLGRYFLSTHAKEEGHLTSVKQSAECFTFE